MRESRKSYRKRTYSKTAKENIRKWADGQIRALNNAYKYERIGISNIGAYKLAIHLDDVRVFADVMELPIIAMERNSKDEYATKLYVFYKGVEFFSIYEQEELGGN